MMKKIFLIFLTFLLFCSMANALVVSDLSDQIESGNKQIIETNAKIVSDISVLKQNTIETNQRLADLDATTFKKEDIRIVKTAVDLSMKEWQAQFLIMFLFVELFQIAVYLYGKSRGWW